jgi:hypothetical protein
MTIRPFCKLPLRLSLCKARSIDLGLWGHDVGDDKQKTVHFVQKIIMIQPSVTIKAAEPPDGTELNSDSTFLCTRKK